MKGRAAVVRDVEHGVALETVEVDEPQAGEVLVRLVASGICGSDLHVLHGRSNAASFPMVLGHEGAGVVEAVGPGVDGFAPGDHVVLALYGPCGDCPACALGRFVHCEGAARVEAIFGRMADGSTRLHTAEGDALHPMVGTGTLAEYEVVRAAQLVKIDDDLPLDVLCLAGCGVTTGLGAAWNVAELWPGAAVAVVGCGGVGLNIVQGARIAGATTIVAVDPSPSRRALAEQLGATAVVDPTGTDITEAVRSGAGRPVDVTFEAVGSPEVVAQTFDAVRPGGLCVVVGVMPPGTTIPIEGRSLFADRRLVGCIGGNTLPRRDIPTIAALYRQGSLELDALVSTRHALDDVSAAIAEAQAGEVARTVVLMGQ